jgi:4-amino-4-deoxy-L-arabinose transferase-like glycosyltransferase
VYKRQGQWLLLLVPALWLGLTTRRQDRSWRLLVVWAIAPFIFFNLASTKRNVYLLPIYPAVALLCAELLARTNPAWAERWQAWVTRVLGVVLGLVGLVLLAVAAGGWSHLPAIPRTTPELITALRPGAVTIGVVLALGGGWILRDSLRLPRRAWLALATTLVVGWSSVLWLVLPVIDTVRSYRPAAQWLVERVPTHEQVGFYWPGREAPNAPGMAVPPRWTAAGVLLLRRLGQPVAAGGPRSLRPDQSDARAHHCRRPGDPAMDHQFRSLGRGWPLRYGILVIQSVRLFDDPSN